MKSKAPVMYFPRRFWFYRQSWTFWLKWHTPMMFGSDEFGLGGSQKRRIKGSLILW